MGYLHPCCWIGSYEYHKMRGIFKPHMEYSMDNYLLDNRTYQKVWEKDFREIEDMVTEQLSKVNWNELSEEEQQKTAELIKLDDVRKKKKKWTPKIV